ncbi:hypothetical protein SAMN06298216_0887 [Spirosomataceae bacterium TFI 002]|nr:hypothetical protein SAMN06298216_0887 [Spirosomataceae bacterium TFI 002]
MKNITLFLIIILTSCQSATLVPSEGIVDLSLNEAKEIQLENEKIKLTLTKIMDSRCPEDATCVRAGEAIASFTFDNQSFDLCIGPDCNLATTVNFKTINGITIKLIEVNPLPKTTNGDMAKSVVVKVEN